MTDGGPPVGMSFPQKVHTEEEDFVIELDENHMPGPHDGYGMDDRSRCKRRKRCGQCGPCQVKENCMKCHFCIRKDVLKQTCIYRKCVYLRSKPKPYSRPHQSPQGRNAASPPREVAQASPLVKSPPVPHPHVGMPFPEPGISMPEPRPDNPFFPQHLPQQAPLVAQQNNGYMSPPHPGMERAPSLPSAAVNNTMNMHMNMSPHPHVQNHAASPPVPKPPDPTSPPLVPQPVNSPMTALSGIPLSSCASVPHIAPPMPHVGPPIPPVMPQLSSHSSLPNIPPIPSIPNMPGLGERSMNDFRHPDQFSLGPHHPHAHYPAVHPHNVMSHRDSGLFSDHSRIAHMNFNHTNPMDTLGRGPNDSSCMYHPGLPYSMPGHYQPSGASFLPGAAEMNPFRSNFLNSFPPGYSYPPDRYREGFGPLPFSRLGMPGMTSSSPFPQYPGQTAGGYGVGNTLSQQYYNSQHGCPKNVSRPPVSPSIDDVKVIQEGYKNKQISPKSKVSRLCDSNMNSDTSRKRHASLNDSGFYDKEFRVKEEISQRERSDHLSVGEISPKQDHLRPWSEFYSHRAMHRFDTLSSPGSRSSNWDPWRMSPWYSPRRDDVRSRASTSTLSSDFECEVICIDDQQVNALIRSDGCNSIEIELDNRSMCSNDSSPRKVASRSSTISDFVTPEKPNCFQPVDKLQISDTRSLFSPWENDRHRKYSGGYASSEKEREDSIKKAFNLFDPLDNLQKHVSTIGYSPAGNRSITSSGRNDHHVWEKTAKKRHQRVKSCFKDSVCIKQDLGDEGVMQLELPGHRVTIENITLSDDLLRECSNVTELKEFISSNHDSSAVP